MEQTFNKIIDLIYIAKKDGVEFILNGEKLQLKVADSKTIDKDLLEDIRNNKQLIIDFLNNDEWKSKKVNGLKTKIKSFDRELVKTIPLSFSQERLLFIDQLDSTASSLYHGLVVLRLKGNLSKQALSFAIKTVIERHHVLRTIYKIENGLTYQQVISANEWHLKEIDTANNEVKEVVEKLSRHPFNLSSDYLLRASLLRIEEEEHVLVVVMHHIATDAWSIPIIIGEVVELYSSYVENRPANLPELQLQYADYAVWQRSYLKGEVLESKLAYWKEKLLGVSPLQLPTDYPRPAVRTSKGASVFIGIDKTTAAGLNELSRQQGGSLYMTLLAAFKVLLYRYSRQQDISVGTSIANRTQQDIEGLVGFFVNTVTLRTQVHGGDSFIQLLQQVKATTLGAYEHQDVPFEKVVETVLKERDASRSPLFQVMLVLLNTPDSPKVQLGQLELSAEPLENTSAKFDITFFVTESSGGLRISAEYSTDLYNKETIQNMLEQYTVLLRAVTAQPTQKVGLLPLLGRQETQHMLQLGRNTTTYDAHANVVTLFEAQVQQHGGQAAVDYEGQQLSYEQLNERANQLAHYLRSKGVKNGDLVPLCIEKGMDMLVGILGILKTGAAYVPVDTAFPAERISWMLEDIRPRVAVTNSESRHKIETAADYDIDIAETDDLTVSLQPKHNPEPIEGSHHLAYVIYTSGSTGRPKGVMIAHRSLNDYVAGLSQKLPIDICKSYALVSTIATDLGNTVIYSSLLKGGTLHLFSKAQVSNIDYLHAYFNKNEIDCLKIVPGHWKALHLEGAALLPNKLLIFGGEALPESIVEQVRQQAPECMVVNHYGPTETTIGKLLHIAGEAKNKYGVTVPIGKPFGNTRVYVLNDQQQVNPVGIPGQLYIAGHGLAGGYYHNAALTDEKFVPDPFRKGEEGTGDIDEEIERTEGTGANDQTGDQYGEERMYATGDLVRYLSDGNIEFMGRVDDQVKIRGYRVELGEIENTIKQYEGISQAVVVAPEDKQGNKKLVAYVVAGGGFSKEMLTIYLKEKLPDYMLPAVLIELESLPLTANGKVDKRALPDADLHDQPQKGYAAPENEKQQQLATIWQDILETEPIGINDDFFELGGHSLLAVRLISAIRKAFNVELPISHIFDYPTIAQLAEQLEITSTEDLLPPITVVDPRPEKIPLSFSQERLWFIDKLEGSVQYHVPAVLRLKGKLHMNLLESAIQFVVNKHEVLRTIIEEDEGIPYQVIKPRNEWKLNKLDGKTFDCSEESLQAHIDLCIQEPFDLSQDYMIRAELISLADNDYFLVVVLHHIASDAWSRSILINEISNYYNSHKNAELFTSELEIQYADFAIWQRNFFEGNLLDKKLDYWRKKLSGVQALQLPEDRLRNSQTSNKGAHKIFTIRKELSNAILDLSQKHGATPFMTLLAIFKILLHRYTSSDDICVGSPVAGRHHYETEKLIGFFINTIALRTNISQDLTFSDLLKQVRNVTLEAYAHQDVPFEKVVETVIKERDLSRTPIFQVMFMMQNAPAANTLPLDDVSLAVLGVSHPYAKFDLTLSFNQSGDVLVGAIEYKTDLYFSETIDRMVLNFTQLAEVIVSDPLRKISYYPLINSSERNQILNNFNDTTKEYPRNKTIIELFENRVHKTPAAIAVISEGKKINYEQLNSRANQVAYFLRNRGVKLETLVPVCIDRSIDLIVGILGILKAGGAYVPIDPDFPEARIKLLLEDVAAGLILVNDKSFARFKGFTSVETVNIQSEIISQQKQENLSEEIIPENLAYIIYTSGSTGKPKGVMVEHRSVVNLVSAPNYVELAKEDILLSTGAPTFDATIFEYWGMLLNGGILKLCSNEILLDPILLKDEIQIGRVSIMWFTSGWFNQLVDTDISVFRPLKKILIGGEKLSMHHVSKFINTYPEITLINGYGPTENTTFSLTAIIKSISNESPIPIGKPLQNRSAYIVDSKLNLTPIGVFGEICLGGDGVARGYLNNEKLSQEKFINNPFIDDGSKIYRTGDYGRWLADGNIEFLGRKDEQVKIRGFRIELAEIESVVLHTGLVEQVAIMTNQDEFGSHSLIGYVVSKDFDLKQLIAQLQTLLPAFMIPDNWVNMLSFPLTSNGKLDRQAFPVSQLTAPSDKGLVAPRNEVESQIVQIWYRLLKKKPISVFDDFFEVGGHSLIAIRLLFILHSELNIKLSIKDLFLNSTVAKLSSLIAARKTNEWVNKDEFRSLVPLKPGGSKKPLYIISGGGGTIFRFREFAKLFDDDQPVYGLQQTDLKEDYNEIPKTIKEIAERYVAEVLIQNPDGPYLISGYCIGGVIGFEMARQLIEKGKKVSMLAMLDTVVSAESNGDTKESRKTFRYKLMSYFRLLKMKYEFEKFLLIRHPKAAINYKVNAVKELFKKLVPGVHDQKEIIITDIYDKLSDILIKSSRQYQFTLFAGKIIAFYAKDHFYFEDKDQKILFKKINLTSNVKNYWKQYAVDTQVYEIDGEHSMIFEPKNGKRLASILQQHLNEIN